MQENHFDMTASRVFLNGFLIGLLIFILANILAAHLLSDCGLPAILGAGFCADDIARAGFPLIFLEEGGFASEAFSICHICYSTCLSGLILPSHLVSLRTGLKNENNRSHLIL